jgi:Subtilase family
LVFRTQNTDNQMTSFIFKFRNELLLAHKPDWRQYLKWPDWFTEQAVPFYRENLYPTNQHDRLVEELTVQFNRFIDVLTQFGLETPTFLFHHVEPKACLNLSNRLKSDRYQTKVATSEAVIPATVQLPNLFNFFQTDLHPSLAHRERDVQAFLEQIRPFLPQKSTYKEVDTRPQPTYLLQYAYLKDDPVPLSFTTPRDALGPNKGQFYFGDMAIPDSPTLPLPPAGITIIEADGWYLNHPQFLTNRQLLFPVPSVFDMNTLNTVPDELTHGTQILGILVAKGGDTDNKSGQDLCRGIAPTLSVRLISCLTSGTKVVGDELDTVRYNEAAAVLTAIDRTPAGETILIELGTAGALFPLDIQPAVYELLGIADRIGITVVEAAGNRGAVLNTVPAGVDDPLMPRDIRTQALTGEPEDNHSKTHWNAYTNPANQKRMAKLASKYHTTAGPTFATVKDFLDHYQETPSPAILVGATVRIGPTQFNLKPDSSRGNRVKVFAQGDGIVTTTVNNEYTADMGSTSGAAAIIAGIVGLVQQVAKAKGLPVTPPGVMAGWLANQPGQPVVSSGGVGVVYVGVVPSCKKVMQQAGLA